MKESDNEYLIRQGPEITIASPIVSPIGQIVVAGEYHNRFADTNQRVLDMYAIGLVTEGSTDYADERHGMMQLRAGDMFLITPGLSHRYGRSEFSHGWIVFDGPVFRDGQRRGIFDAFDPVIHVEPVNYWHDQMRYVICHPRYDGKRTGLEAVFILLRFLAEAIAHAKCDQMRVDQRQWIEQAQTIMMRQAPRLPLDIDALVDEMHLSYNAFYKRYHRLTGESPTAFHSRCVLDRAAYLIGQGMSFKEIARVCGFSDEFHFSKRFRQVKNMTPSQFRNCLRPR